MDLKELLELCSRIDLPAEVTVAVCARAADCPHSTEALYQRLSSQAGEQALRTSLDDPDGLQMLTYMLLAGRKTQEFYRMRRIPDALFYDTFRCFSRFVEEHHRQLGTYGFDRSYWTWRQVGLRLFRLGELEFELTELDGVPAVGVHIPSSARLANYRASYRQAASFFREQAPAYADAPYFCDSWLLSPALVDLLPPPSRILTFQQDFDLCRLTPEDREFMTWVFGRSDLPLEQLPEDTTLRRNVKAFLAQGELIGSATGILRSEAFKNTP